MSDIAIRKKKNADAQAAFRQRRANYIATLEETVTSLESVVLQLQDSCREARSETSDLRQDNSRLKNEYRERENFWRALWQARKTGHTSESDDPDLPPLPSSFNTMQATTPTSAMIHNGDLRLNSYRDEGLTYRGHDDSSVAFGHSSSYGAGPSQNYPSQPPHSGTNGDPIHGDGLSNNFSVYNRYAKRNEYTYPAHNGAREPLWPQAIQDRSSSESPILTSSEMSFSNRYSADSHKLRLNPLDTAPYIFSSSRSLSPTASTPPSSSSTSLTSTLPLPYPDSSINQDPLDFDYHRPNTRMTEVTLHGGTADVSFTASGSDGVRYRIGPRGTNPGPDHSVLPGVPYFSDNSSQHERASSEGELGYPRLHPHLRSTHRESRSPSPGAPPVSGTLAVIKAQAFGALRRTRVRNKKSSEGAAKVAMEVLEARGIGMGVGGGTKRPRLQDQNDML